MTTRRGTVLVAAVCALVAAGIIVYALNKYRDNLNNGSKPETVFVASSLIQKGTSGAAIAAEQLFRPTRIATKQVTHGAIADSAQLSGKVALTDIYPGQQMTLTDFGPASGVTATLARGERAVEVPVQGAPGLVGNLAAGQRVDLYVDLSNGGNGGGANLVRLLATNILVLQPATNGGGVGSTNNGGNLTLALANNLVPAIMYASDNGKLWLALRPGNASNPKRGESATLGSILTGK